MRQWWRWCDEMLGSWVKYLQAGWSELGRLQPADNLFLINDVETTVHTMAECHTASSEVEASR
jgi:hypothetical protein